MLSFQTLSIFTYIFRFSDSCRTECSTTSMREREGNRERQWGREGKREIKETVDKRQKRMSNIWVEIGWVKQTWNPRFGRTCWQAWYWPLGPGLKTPASILSNVPAGIWGIPWGVGFQEEAGLPLFTHHPQSTEFTPYPRKFHVLLPPTQESTLAPFPWCRFTQLNGDLSASIKDTIPRF